MDFYVGGLWDMCLNKLRNARIMLKKNLKVIFRLPLLSTSLSLRFFAKMKKKKICQQHPVFPGGHPSKYWLDSTLLNFSDRTRTGVFNVIWPLAFESDKFRVFQSLFPWCSSRQNWKKIEFWGQFSNSSSPFCSDVRGWKSVNLPLSNANGHITLNTPVLVRSLKLSNVETC